MADWYLCALRNSRKNLEKERKAVIQRLSHRFIYLGIAEQGKEYTDLKDVYYETLDLLSHYSIAATYLRYVLLPELTTAIKRNLVEKCVKKSNNHDSGNLLPRDPKVALSAVNEMKRFEEWEKSKANRLRAATSESLKRDWDISIEEYELSDLLCKSFLVGFEYKIYLCAIGSDRKNFSSQRGTAIEMLSDDCVYLGNANFDQVENSIGAIFYQMLDIFNISRDAASLMKLNCLPQVIAMVEEDLRDANSRSLRPGPAKVELKRFERWLRMKSERRSKVEHKNNEWKRGLGSDLRNRKIYEIC